MKRATTARAQGVTWTEYPAPEATTDRGWLKAMCQPYDRSKWMEYTDATTPVYDEEIKAWREQCTLGNYLDYGPCRRDYSPETVARLWPDGHVHAVCYASHTSRYFRTVADAKAWIESEALRVRPDLAGLAAAA